VFLVRWGMLAPRSWLDRSCVRAYRLRARAGDGIAPDSGGGRVCGGLAGWLPGWRVLHRRPRCSGGGNGCVTAAGADASPQPASQQSPGSGRRSGGGWTRNGGGERRRNSKTDCRGLGGLPARWVERIDRYDTWTTVLHGFLHCRPVPSRPVPSHPVRSGLVWSGAGPPGRGRESSPARSCPPPVGGHCPARADGEPRPVRDARPSAGRAASSAPVVSENPLPPRRRRSKRVRSGAAISGCCSSDTTATSEAR